MVVMELVGFDFMALIHFESECAWAFLGVLGVLAVNLFVEFDPEPDCSYSALQNRQCHHIHDVAFAAAATQIIAWF